MTINTGSRTAARQYDPASKTACATTILPKVPDLNLNTSPEKAPVLDRNGDRPARTGSR